MGRIAANAAWDGKPTLATACGSFYFAPAAHICLPPSTTRKADVTSFYCDNEDGSGAVIRLGEHDPDWVVTFPAVF
jgi:hypothetical protein